MRLFFKMEKQVIFLSNSENIISVKNLSYSYKSDDDLKTDVLKKTNNYHEVIYMKNIDDVTGEEIIVRSLKQPNCIKADIEKDNIVYTIEKELGIELVGDVKVRIEADEEEDAWDEIVEDRTDTTDSTQKTIDDVKEDYIDENQAI